MWPLSYFSCWEQALVSLWLSTIGDGVQSQHITTRTYTHLHSMKVQYHGGPDSAHTRVVVCGWDFVLFLFVYAFTCAHKDHLVLRAKPVGCYAPFPSGDKTVCKVLCIHSSAINRPSTSHPGLLYTAISHTSTPNAGWNNMFLDRV
jgi:hypothetical protein